MQYMRHGNFLRHLFQRSLFTCKRHHQKLAASVHTSQGNVTPPLPGSALNGVQVDKKKAKSLRPTLVPTSYTLKKVHEDLRSFNGDVSSSKSLAVAAGFSRARCLFTLYCMKMEGQAISCHSLASALTERSHDDFDFLDDVDTLRDSSLKFNDFLSTNGQETTPIKIKQRQTMSSEIVVGLLMIKYMKTPIPLIASEVTYLQYIPVDLFIELWGDLTAMGLTSPKLVHLYLAKSSFPAANRSYVRIRNQLSDLLNVKGAMVRNAAAVIRILSTLDDVKSAIKFLRQCGFSADEIAQVPHLLAYGVSEISQAVERPPSDLKSYLDSTTDNVTRLSLLFSYLERERGFQVTYLESAVLSKMKP